MDKFDSRLDTAEEATGKQEISQNKLFRMQQKKTKNGKYQRLVDKMSMG